MLDPPIQSTNNAKDPQTELKKLKTSLPGFRTCLPQTGAIASKESVKARFCSVCLRRLRRIEALWESED